MNEQRKQNSIRNRHGAAIGLFDGHRFLTKCALHAVVGLNRVLAPLDRELRLGCEEESPLSEWSRPEENRQ